MSAERLLFGMRYVRMTLTPTDTEIHPVFDIWTGREYVAGVELVHWNVTDPDSLAMLFRVEGDRERVATEIEACSAVISFDVSPIGDGEFYVHLQPKATETIYGLFSAFTAGSLVVTPPIRYGDGSASTGIVGTAADLQAALEAVPDGITVDVTQIGDYDGATSTATDLSDRQREAVLAALDMGYYDTPRRVTHEALAERLNCAPSTVTEHLQKAEKKIIAAAMADER